MRNDRYCPLVFCGKQSKIGGKIVCQSYENGGLGDGGCFYSLVMYEDGLAEETDVGRF